MIEIVNVVEFPEKKEEKPKFKDKVKEKIDSSRDKVADKLHKTADFVRENKELLIVIIPIGAKLVSRLSKDVTRHRTVKEERYLRDNYVYDNRLGHYWELKRKASNSEWKIIERRKNNGESLGIILSDLKLLKK